MRENVKKDFKPGRDSAEAFTYAKAVKLRCISDGRYECRYKTEPGTLISGETYNAIGECRDHYVLGVISGSNLIFECVAPKNRFEVIG